MTEIKNSTSGIGDPYWYEWTVGLDQTINMLNPDNNIKSITLQAPDLQDCKGLSLEKKKSILNELINLHKLWITGNYTIPFKIKYEINSEGDFVDNWSELFSSL
ncbi:hypothetical protein [Lysinibacillus fusiformis]|uniref:hypothetical protein n=1 Tax=Lysinibacillus fusiformis TaxID=28031 RepID=UPI001248A038|nr:hypothetical protein [Lysinibacillus fusiformis]KAB0441038.1 hypothetical protein CH314_20820 [Lysinibacillus fusiformis]